jgi:hypothetical protein
MDLVASNPRGWGTLPVEPEIAYEDDAGGLWGFDGKRVGMNYKAPGWEAPDQSWQESLLGIGTAPAKLAVGIADSLSPYSSEEGWRIPPMAEDAYTAARATGDAYRGLLSPDEMQQQAFNAAGFMMGGGLARHLPTEAMRDGLQAGYRNMRYRSEPSAMDAIPEDLMRTVRDTQRRTDLAGTASNKVGALGYHDTNLASGAPSQWQWTGVASDNMQGAPANYLAALYGQRIKPELRSVDGGQSSLAKSKPFFDSGFRFSDGSSITIDDAYKKYSEWSARRGISPISRDAFDDQMISKGVLRQRMAGKVRYIGIDFTK